MENNDSLFRPGRDVILHEEMSIDERNAELERLRKESEALTEWEEVEVDGRLV